MSVFVLSSLLALSVLAQSAPPERPRVRPASALAGWADWEKGKEIFRRIQVPPAPALTPEQAQKTFRIASGFRLELFAAEPMIANPIFFEFDPEGRLWAIEYRGYMRDLAGTGEGDPICRIVVLEDTDGDGRADRQTVFLDGLVMPRTFAFVEGGVLVAEPPRLWFCEDTNGDLRCDRKRQVGSYGVAGNPQHTANGLRYGLDNWLHNSDWPKRHRFVHGTLLEQETIHRGQFGGSFDPWGRFYTCYESSALHADLLPVESLLRNAHLRQLLQRRGGGRNERAFGVAVNVATEAQEVFPIRPTPQITLGGLELRDDGRLRTYTVVSGSCIYDGHQFPAEAHGNAFIPEAGGHLIGRLRLSGDLQVKAERFYPAEQEILASTDERFRPVNARVGPDGALYIADMYHGVIEHVIFLVPWLTEQVKERGLESGNDMGRIWRLVAEDRPIDRRSPRLSNASSDELVRLLDHPNGWHRLTAQRLLVERRDRGIVPVLNEWIISRRRPGEDVSGAEPREEHDREHALGRLHALWTLDGLEALAWPVLSAAVRDPNPVVRATAARLTERFGTEAQLRAESLEALGLLLRDPHPQVRLHAVLALGAFPSEERLPWLLESVSGTEDDLFRAAAASTLQDLELVFLERLLKDDRWRAFSAHRGAMLRLLAELVFVSHESGLISALLSTMNSEMSERLWRTEALLEGILHSAPGDLAQAEPVTLTAEPAILARLAESGQPSLVQKGLRLHALLTWPGDNQLRSAAVKLAPLSDAERALVERGQALYGMVCAACHQPDGGGLPSVAPPLRGSEWVHGDPARLVRVVLHGLYGPLQVQGQAWHHHMPGFGNSILTNDTDVAGILGYVRRAWGNSAALLKPSFVQGIRAATADREGPWTAAELGVTGERALSAGERHVVGPDAQGTYSLLASLAQTYGRRLKYNPTLDVLAPWVEENDVAEWQVEVRAAGTYQVHVLLGADTASAGDQFAIETRSGRLLGTVPDTGGNAELREQMCGTLRLGDGRQTLILRPHGPLRRELADVRSLRLVPVP